MVKEWTNVTFFMLVQCFLRHRLLLQWDMSGVAGGGETRTAVRVWISVAMCLKIFPCIRHWLILLFWWPENFQNLDAEKLSNYNIINLISSKYYFFSPLRTNANSYRYYFLVQKPENSSVTNGGKIRLSKIVWSMPGFLYCLFIFLTYSYITIVSDGVI